MQNLAEQRKGAMYVVKPYSHDALREQIDNLGLGTVLNVCCDNGHQQQVVGGELTAVKTLVNHLARLGVNTIKLGVNGAWHTPLMQDGVAQMRQALADLPFSSPVCPLIMNSSGKAEYDVAQIKGKFGVAPLSIPCAGVKVWIGGPRWDIAAIWRSATRKSSATCWRSTTGLTRITISNTITISLAAVLSMRDKGDMMPTLTTFSQRYMRGAVIPVVLVSAILTSSLIRQRH
ncbi:Malonyl CoA-acyl carrier protein transacylase [Serratia fonticola]|uniref:[acyl-carrier-protein] S-malonyltransferase n=1 Tax=Serratia fonticola TaxID=47917 RepID=A0A4U9VVU2_SERFO|nr:Malonyl CoA-acyl carrier protein transacylase [Serratia fonticola]